MRTNIMFATIAALSLALLSSCEKKSESITSSCEKKSESITSSSELVSQNFIDSYILLSANEEISDTELDEAARIFGRRTDALQILYRTYVDYDSDSIRIDFKYDDSSADKLLETITDKNIIEFRKGSDYSSSELIFGNDAITKSEVMAVSKEDGTQDFIVSVEFNNEASIVFTDVTEELAGTDIPISIWFNSELISAPLVLTKIDAGLSNISGNFDYESALELSEKINSEPLKYDFSVTKHEFETAYN